MKRIAIQGEPGSYSHLTADRLFPGCTLVCGATFEDVIDAVASGRADAGMLPIENFTAGRVAGANALMPVIADLGLRFTRETFTPITHHLLGLPGATIESITHVWSHEQALKQSEALFKRYPHLHREQHIDTAGAAAMIATRGDPTQAAIASEMAGRLYGLVSLADDFTLADNATRFLVVERAADVVWPEVKDTSPTITSFFFDLPDTPGSLYRALGVFAETGINLDSLQSYTRRFSHAHFYAEAEGHPDGALGEALASLDRQTEKPTTILGVYAADPYRRR